MFPMQAKSANEIYALAREELVRLSEQKLVASRAGETVEILGAMIELVDPRQRWTSVRYPAMNPAFALVEVLWIVFGRNDAALPNHWNPRLPRFAGPGLTYYGAYGERLARRFSFDQLERAHLALAKNPSSRQVVLQVWDTGTDFPTELGQPRAYDIPCNICALLKVRDNRLEWTQIMRSNDVLRGLPHNLVQWTSIQEILAGWLGLELGSYRQYSDSLHIYADTLEDLRHPLSSSAGLNSDDIRLPRKSSLPMMRRLEELLNLMVTGSLNPDEACKLAESQEMPVAYHNWLVIIVSDHLRRSQCVELAGEVLRHCTNDQLVAMMRAWLARTVKR